MNYQQAVERASALIASWRELLQDEARLLASGDRETVLATITRKHSLPAQVHCAILQAAEAAAQWYAQLAQDEEQRIAELDGELQPLLDELRQLQQRVDELVRERRGREHRLTVLQTCQRSAAQLTSLSSDRVTTPTDAEAWLAKLPPCEEPPPAEPAKRLTEV
ncbi:MAG: hypothetical protein KatS3mg022_3197 [Armatimonadota bacterium]|nr:MAG: hypothetical protein KatS3mg022_3197 [Armatimonadota bacterium]